MQLNQLHSKVSNFFDEVQSRNNEAMSCKAGCARCCYVDLSVFKIEADYIEKWFSHLSYEEKLKRIGEWEKPHIAGSCLFLRDEKCTIYEARPTICRSQGLPLKFEIDGEIGVDACPLNFEDLEVELKDCLDLDRVNLILSTLEVQHSGSNVPRIRLTDLLTKLKGLI